MTSALSPWSCPALPSVLVLCQPRVVCRRGAAPPRRTLNGRGLYLSPRGPTGGCTQGPKGQRSLPLRILKPRPLRFPRELIVSCAPGQAREDRK